MQQFKIPLLISAGLHVLMIAILVGVNYLRPSTPEVITVTLNAPSNEDTPQKAVDAVAVDQKQVEKRIDELRKQEEDKKRAEQKRIRELEKRAELAKRQRQEEANRIKKLEQERKAKEEERKKAEAEAKKAREIERKERDKAKKAQLEKEKAEKAAKAAAEKRRKEEEAARKAEEERKRKEAEAKRKAEEARQKALQEQMLQEQMAAEQAVRAKARRQQVLSEVDKYRALIGQRIQQNLLLDDSFRGKECRLNIKLAFNGLVTSVNSLGGDRQVCEAAVRAVRRADTLPVSKDRDVFEELKNINLTVKPEF
ncbi:MULTISPECIES: cell envelope integrity protein TolA [unclassified Pseudoalteromonas]|uniref:cell envelope integrity protein TolA n=1 Tax=unclassified Pseudoalteromonas TaxID=194690 RepID=UPI000CF5F4AE|nr:MULTISPECIES: cell envelope integrity protein TolA [unclassified Pseudoalteromonas]